MTATDYNSNPKVSAIVPNYNYADFLIERVDSILAQTYPVEELVILDDASSDDSVKVIKGKLEEVKIKFPKVTTKLIVNRRNSGGRVFSQWLKGLNEVTGDFIWIAEADDSCDIHFLETAMQKFKEHPDAELFYSDSLRINQDGEVTSDTCSDWADIWRQGRWEQDYYNTGKDEIINYLSAANTILNVSSVVWRNNKQLPQIFKEAEKYKVAGDWYIYYKVLELGGGIVYSAKPLNHYRKHDRGSASTVVKSSTEYVEMCRIQDQIAEKYQLSPKALEMQKVRRRGLGFIENPENSGTKAKIAWLAPDFPVGSGGHRTVFTNLNHLIEKGYHCDSYINSTNHELPIEIYNRIVENYDRDFKGDIFDGFELVRDYDMVIATSWDTAEAVSKSNAKHKIYFIQDFEPWFFSMGDDYISAERSYSYGLSGISIGRWLSNKISTNYPTKTTFFNFCADLKSYKPLKNAKKENAICFVFQPEKPRRCHKLALRALQIVQKAHPETKIYFYGSPKQEVHNLKVENLGTISVEKCNELYNKCSVGLCMSLSNPSRIPFEMMAAGLPVVELYRENNLYDLPEDGCLLAEPSAEAVATAIIKLLEDEKLRAKLSKSGHDFMQKYPLEKGYDQFAGFIEKCFNNKKASVSTKSVTKIYKKSAVESSDLAKALSEEITAEVHFNYPAPPPPPPAPAPPKRSLPRRVASKVKRTLRRSHE